MKDDSSDSDLSTIIRSLKDDSTALLVLDTVHCPHSQRLLDEIEIACCLTPSTSKSALVMHLLDLSKHKEFSLARLPWLPGVPCLLVCSKVHLGIDAFAKCREYCRSTDGVTIHRLP